jgi:hypothetical protein
MNALKFTAEMDARFWRYNLPLQVQRLYDDDQPNGKYAILNYMARRGRCEQYGLGSEVVRKEDIAAICHNSAAILRNLADLFDALGKGETKEIYYPTTPVEEARADAIAEDGASAAT